MSIPVLRLAGIAKSFGGTRALSNAALELFPGQVTALLGENGAGKSTLVKILTGVYQPDSGELEIEGSPVKIHAAQKAQELGISVIHQESVVFDDLTVAENIFIAKPPRRHGMIDWRAMYRHAEKLLAQIGEINAHETMGKLSVAQKHLVQIARALSHDSRIVILDEPTAALSQTEAADLLRIVGRLRDEGRAVLYISHKFEEVLSIADRFVVFRDGAWVGDGLIADTNLDALIRLMVGRSLEQAFPKSAHRLGDEVLRVERLCREPEFTEVSFDARRGEILGVYGLVGSGRSNVMRCVFGLEAADRGRIALNGALARFSHPDAAVQAGVAYVPEDRQGQGAILSRSIANNIGLPSLPNVARRGLLSQTALRSQAEYWLKELGIKAASVEQLVQELSGGNQQKVVLAKWLLTKPQVLILDEPTKGIDVGAKATVHRLISELAAQGMAIILVSSELPEILGMSDRILVMRRGRVQGTFPRNTSAEDILRAAAA